MSVQDTMRALSDPTRREILNLLRQNVLTAGEIVERFDISNASISHHLSILKQAGLILDDKRGKYIYYEINTTVLDEILEWFQILRGGNTHETE
ncbi:MAG: autorepressor SdpR family transcription factor [Lachnospiraceae bacterium]